MDVVDSVAGDVEDAPHAAGHDALVAEGGGAEVFEKDVKVFVAVEGDGVGEASEVLVTVAEELDSDGAVHKEAV